MTVTIARASPPGPAAAAGSPAGGGGGAGGPPAGGSPAGGGLGTVPLLFELAAVGGPGHVDEAAVVGADRPERLAEAAGIVRHATGRVAEGDRKRVDALQRWKLLHRE